MGKIIVQEAEKIKIILEDQEYFSGLSMKISGSFH